MLLQALCYSPETSNLGQIRRFFEPCDLAIWRMILKNNRTPLLFYFKLCASIKDLSMMYRALWDRRHEGATRVSQCTRRVAPSALTYPRGPWVPPISQCTIHHALIRLWHELFGFDTLRSRNLQAKFRSGRWRIMHCRKSMHGFVGHVHSNAFVTW